jgi:hypothetical protein
LTNETLFSGYSYFKLHEKRTNKKKTTNYMPYLPFHSYLMGVPHGQQFLAVTGMGRTMSLSFQIIKIE